MNERIVSECSCNVCNASVQEVYDTPIFGGRWGYICRRCVARQNVDIHTGTYLRTEAGKPYWRTKEIKATLNKVMPHLTWEGKAYLKAMERAWCQYDEMGLMNQMNYIIANLKDDTPLDLQSELEALQFAPQP